MPFVARYDDARARMGIRRLLFLISWKEELLKAPLTFFVPSSVWHMCLRKSSFKFRITLPSLCCLAVWLRGLTRFWIRRSRMLLQAGPEDGSA